MLISDWYGKIEFAPFRKEKKMVLYIHWDTSLNYYWNYSFQLNGIYFVWYN